MLTTNHNIVFSNSKNLNPIKTESINLVVTSPPYPMIEMWDELFRSNNGKINDALSKEDGNLAFNLMHEELDAVWLEVYRVLKDGGIACINIGDATRTIGDTFKLYSNHARIIHYCTKIGFDVIPVILWRKQTNAPNKFMGSGMLPPGAYVTLEHEYILIFRKNGKRKFIKPSNKLNRQQSSFFWEERNKWFSDIWNFKGVNQKLNNKNGRNRSAAFPFELAYRLINMYSVKGDYVLDPFLGTGTTTFAAMASCRNSIGIEIDKNFKSVIDSQLAHILPLMNSYIRDRINAHLDFTRHRESEKGKLKHINKHYNFSVMASQETNMIINYLKKIERLEKNSYKVTYFENAILNRDGHNIQMSESGSNMNNCQLVFA